MHEDDDDAVSALRAVAHPIRLRILSLLTGTAMSAAEVARELELTHANASYHLRRLADAGELVVDGEERIRGGMAKRYRYPHERERRRHRSSQDADDATEPGEGGHSPSEDQVFYVRATAAEVERRVGLTRPGGTGFSFDLEGWVEPEVWERAVDLLAEASALLHDANQPPRSEGTVHVSGTAWAFELEWT